MRGDFLKEETVIVKNPTGLHARPAAIVVSASTKFKSSIYVKKGAREVNLKSLLSLLSLGICHNDSITIKTEGSDENEALIKILDVIESIKE
jgi:phosphotransferase system HPr (HPr) family protein